MKKLFFETEKDDSTEHIMKILEVQTVWSLDYLEMILMILWQSVVQNGCIKMV